jgi:FtsP/CotA-like multicopper oxidase with cupredoxin domain
MQLATREDLREDLRLVPAEEVQPRFVFSFTNGGAVQRDGQAYTDYGVNGAAYSMAMATKGMCSLDGKNGCKTLLLDTVEEWEVINADPTTNHDFHMHVNAFQVVAIGNGSADDAAAAAVDFRVGDWRDTITVPTVGVTIRFRPTNFTGMSLVHCHVLGHEDQGMMMAIDIQRPAVPTSPEPAPLLVPGMPGSAELQSGLGHVALY